MKEYCNPININYKFQHYGKSAHREAADPTLIYFKNKYYIFASMSAGFYHSDDLANWIWHENRKLDMYRYAPDVRQIGEYLYFCASNLKPSTIWRTKDPLSDIFEKVSEPFGFWDPALFYDDDGKTYIFWGCGNRPLFGRELDTKTMLPKGKKVKIIEGRPSEHGWERFFCKGFERPEPKNFLMKYIAPMSNPKGKPYIEGAYVNKFNGRYYFQYAAPATEFPVYGNGVYTSDKPLGPYHFQAHNPFSFKPTGFINGAGHGSTIEDRYGNLWHIASMRISVNQNFERRLGLFPAGIDDNGILFCNQNFADYPIIFPDEKFNPKELQPHYMLLSYKKTATASSCLEGHPCNLALNEDIRTWWCAQGSADEWYQVDLGKEYLCHSIQINLAEEGIPAQKHKKSECAQEFGANKRYIDSSKNLVSRYIIEGSSDGKNWFILCDKSDTKTDLSHDYIVLEEDFLLRYIKITSVELPYNQKFAISGLRVFGLDDGDKPSNTTNVYAQRISPFDAAVSWDKCDNAIGYNVKYGIAPDKLYSSYLIYESNKVTITTLNKGQDYWFCVDSFNESGITQGTVNKIR